MGKAQEELKRLQKIKESLLLYKSLLDEDVKSGKLNPEEIKVHTDSLWKRLHDVRFSEEQAQEALKAELEAVAQPAAEAVAPAGAAAAVEEAEEVPTLLQNTTALEELPLFGGTSVYLDCNS